MRMAFSNEDAIRFCLSAGDQEHEMPVISAGDPQHRHFLQSRFIRVGI